MSRICGSTPFAAQHDDKQPVLGDRVEHRHFVIERLRSTILRKAREPASRS
jgi:hypothetical protein